MKNWMKLYFPSLLLRHKWHTNRRNLKVDDVCLLQDEWKMAKVVEIYPDRNGTVRNIQVLIKPNQDETSKYKSSQGYEVKRQVSKLLLLVPAEDQENCGKEEVEDVEVDKVISEDEVKDAEVEKVILEDDVEVKSTVLEEDDVCDAMAPSVSSSYNSPDAQKQDEDAAEHQEEDDKEPGGNVIASRRSPRFGHTNA